MLNSIQSNSFFIWNWNRNLELEEQSKASRGEEEEKYLPNVGGFNSPWTIDPFIKLGFLRCSGAFSKGLALDGFLGNVRGRRRRSPWCTICRPGSWKEAPQLNPWNGGSTVSVTMQQGRRRRWKKKKIGIKQDGRRQEAYPPHGFGFRCLLVNQWWELLVFYFYSHSFCFE